MEVLSDAGTPRINSIAENDDDDKEKEEKLSDSKSDSGAGDSEASTIGKDDKDNEEDDLKASKIIGAGAAVAAPTIAAGGTVFATAAKRSRKGETLCGDD